MERFTQRDILKLLEIYKSEESLWNINSNAYKLLHIKNKAYQKLANELSCDVNTVKKKLRYLRSAYVAEKKKCDSSKKSGSSSDDVYISNLYYFDAMHFLDPILISRQSSSNAPPQTEADAAIEVEYAMEVTVDEMPTTVQEVIFYF